MKRTVIAALLLAAAAAGGAAEHRPARAATAAPATSETARLQRLADSDAIRALAYHYGRGNDQIALYHADRAKGRRLGEAEYRKAFAPDVQVEVFALGGTQPIGTARGVAAWVEFVDQFYAKARYSSSVHLMSNFDIQFVDADTARVSNYASVPHFILADARDAASAQTTLEYMVCRYEYEARRQPDGSWKTTRLRIHLDEIWRAPGFYPGGQAKGL